MFCLNVCGLASKLNVFEGSEDSDYFSSSNSSTNRSRPHIFIFDETKTDTTSEALINDTFKNLGYKTFFKHRKNLSIYKSGGIIICVDTSILEKCKHIDTKCAYVSWNSIDKTLLNTEKD